MVMPIPRASCSNILTSSKVINIKNSSNNTKTNNYGNESDESSSLLRGSHLISMIRQGFVICQDITKLQKNQDNL